MRIIKVYFCPTSCWTRWSSCPWDRSRHTPGCEIGTKEAKCRWWWCCWWQRRRRCDCCRWSPCWGWSQGLQQWVDHSSTPESMFKVGSKWYWRRWPCIQGPFWSWEPQGWDRATSGSSQSGRPWPQPSISRGCPAWCRSDLRYTNYKYIINNKLVKNGQTNLCSVSNPLSPLEQRPEINVFS